MGADGERRPRPSGKLNPCRALFSCLACRWKSHPLLCDRLQILAESLLGKTHFYHQYLLGCLVRCDKHEVRVYLSPTSCMCVFGSTVRLWFYQKINEVQL